MKKIYDNIADEIERLKEKLKKEEFKCRESAFDVDAKYVKKLESLINFCKSNSCCPCEADMTIDEWKCEAD